MKKWNYSFDDSLLEAVEKIVKKFKVSNFVAYYLAKRGFDDEEEIEKFLFPSYSHLYPAELLGDISKAVNRIIKSIKDNEHIVIYGDYDIDGLTATAILVKALRELGCVNVSFYIPDRNAEGYGLNNEAVEKLAQNHELMITVDLGIVNQKEVEIAQKNGMDVIITDHHLPQTEKIPNAFAIINPHYHKKYPFEDLAGCGVAFKLAERLMQVYKKDENIQLRREYFDFATIGTIGDCVPLLGENRTIVKIGLSQLSKTENQGLAALIKKSGLRANSISATDVSFSIAPLINAASRMSEVQIVLDLLLSEDEKEIEKLAKKLVRLNNKRKKLVDEQTDFAFDMMKGNIPRDIKVIVLSHINFDEGLAGIIASRVAEKYSLPTIIIDASSGKGSARSVGSVNIFEGIKSCSDLLIKFGGHQMAAGLKIDIDNLEEFNININNWASKLPKDLFQSSIEIDLEIPLQVNAMWLIGQLNMLEPFGQDNPNPVFKTSKVELVNPKQSKNKRHLNFISLQDDKARDCVYWHINETIQKQIIELAKQQKVDIAYNLTLNNFFNCEKLQLELLDVKASSNSTSIIYNEIVQSIIEQSELKVEGEDYIKTKVKGASYGDRQQNLLRLDSSSSVYLIREEDNEYDANAIQISSNEGQLGYIDANLARKLAPLVDRGVKFVASILEVTGFDKKVKGANILIDRVLEGES
ncbi:MAG: single-stranded-DNA-specific exonuclease RecJ [bacterium]